MDEALLDPAMAKANVFHGAGGRLVLTVQAETPVQTRLLARAAGAGIEAAIWRNDGLRLDRH